MILTLIYLVVYLPHLITYLHLNYKLNSVLITIETGRAEITPSMSESDSPF